MIETKPLVYQSQMKAIVRTEFHKYRGLERKDFFRIDYFVKRAHKYLDVLKHPSCEFIESVAPARVPPPP